MGNDPCRCDCAYVGAQLAGTPIRCEECGGLVDEVAAERMKVVYAEARRRLEEREGIPTCPTCSQDLRTHGVRCPGPLSTGTYVGWGGEERTLTEKVRNLGISTVGTDIDIETGKRVGEEDDDARDRD